MHNGRVLKHGTPDEIENDAEVQAIYMGGGRHGGGHALSLFGRGPSRPGAGPILADRQSRRLLRPRPRAAGRVAVARPRRARRGRPQRHGQDDALQRHHRPGARRRGVIRFAGQEILGLPPNRITNLGIGYVPQGRRVWPSLTVDEHLRLAQRSAAAGRGPSSASTRPFPRLAERRTQRRRAALRRRAADAGDRPRAAVRSQAAGDGRADRGACAGHRRAGRSTC